MAAFDEATRDLHEGAVVRKALQLPKVTASPEETQEGHEGDPSWDAAPAEPPINRLLTPEERGDAPEESQVDLLSSIGELTLAEKLALQPLGSVAEGMSILDRAQYTSVLFSGEEEVFSTLLEKLSRASTQEEALAMFPDLKMRIHDLAASLSGGERQMLAISRALISKPKFLLLDEPTASLDPETGDFVRSFLEEYQRENKTSILLASHNMSEVERLCSSVLMMNKGTIIDQGTPRELINKHGRKNMEEVFLKLTRETV